MRKKDLPKPTGAYAVGTTTYTVKDDRDEVLPKGGKRSIAARVYYPVLKESVRDLPKVTALSDNMLKAFRRAFGIAPNFRKNPDANLSECYAGAQRIPGEKFPLILFSHGYGSYREGNSFLCIELASHGYVVISVAHSLEAMCTEFDDGSILNMDKSLNAKTYEPRISGMLAALRLMKAKGSDEVLADKFDEVQRKYCRFMMERLPEWVRDNEAALACAKKDLSDLIDFEKGIGVSGHSFGGDTAYALCARNPEFVCGVNMDGALFGDYAKDVQTKPFLQISCTDYEYIVTRAYLRHTKPVYKALFRNVKHMGFSDVMHTLPLKSVVGKQDPDAVHENVCRCHLAFFDAYLKGVTDTPNFESSDAVTVSVFPPDL